MSISLPVEVEMGYRKEILSPCAAAAQLFACPPIKGLPFQPQALYHQYNLQIAFHLMHHEPMARHT